jgi:hypothetical protein
MDIESAIKAYVDLSKVIFVPRKRNMIGGHVVQNILGNATFDAKKLERFVKNVLVDALEDENAVLLQTEPQCRMSVTKETV